MRKELENRLESLVDTLLECNPLGLAWEGVSFAWRWLRRSPPRIKEVERPELWISKEVFTGLDDWYRAGKSPE